MKFFAALSTLLVVAAASPLNIPVPVAVPANVTELEARGAPDQPVTVTCWDQVNFKGNVQTYNWPHGTNFFPFTGPLFQKVSSCCVCAPALNSGVVGYTTVTSTGGSGLIPLSKLGGGWTDRLHDGCYPNFFQYNNQIGGVGIWTTA